MNGPERAIQHYLRTGEHDPLYAAWPGDVISRAKRGHTALRHALIAAVEENSPSKLEAPCPPGDVAAHTREKVTPMVRGLFPKREHAAVIDLLERSVVYLTPGTIGSVLSHVTWPRTAWALANLYLDGVGGERLSPLAPEIVGLSEETTCYISPACFSEASPFADYIVHEAAHVFHNCKRRTIGLAETKRSEWLLDIAFAKRELFAYCCEAYSRIVAVSSGSAERRVALEALAAHPMPDDNRVDHAEYLDVLRDATEARNGWRRIRDRCGT